MKAFRRHRLVPLTVLPALLLGACGTVDSVAGSNSGDRTIVVGSQAYYSNEIIAEIYAQALERAGYNVDRQFQIGQREVYMKEIESGSIDIMPEYTGPLLQYWQPDTSARKPAEVLSGLQEAAPDNLVVLEPSDAADQDAYVVTREFAEQYGLRTIADLAKVPTALTLGANSEAEHRPNGPEGLKEVYGIDVGFTPIEDSGGPLTVKSLKDGDIQLAIIYTSDPAIEENDLVILEDPKGQFVSSNVVPLAFLDIYLGGAEVVERVNGYLDTPTLQRLNRRSVTEQLPASQIAGDFLDSVDAG
ncbi:ABC transporter substrate-binding protein [Corynebacterium pelargi]|uniref:Glycine betaine/carnitine/choline-binding protein OpuCC n=1 Tax=Corynebacterium pelargi TaxID=1471400 RepID=A0A410W5U9_9CORY|nr:ABC transporter substrate-binding protein [Corynebacterium pelargi]QAU51421.1 Glycine betaine/carnitine/choline-binding protein OpuCC precursor [Corynebacterium pelargi]GGG81070.1 glycine/betaine ABC transporter permease [Corynebacterium pelargi]